MQPLYPYLGRLSLYPNAEVRFVARAPVPSKAKSEPAKSFILPPRSSRGDSPETSVLDRKPKFHEKEGQTGYGKLPDRWPSFSNSAKRAIKLRGAALSNLFSRDQQIFLTGTLPGSTDEAIQTFAKWSGWLMDRLQKWLRDNYSIDGKLYHLGVWELQRRGALHYHALCCTDNPNDLMLNFRSFWLRLLYQLSEYTGVDLFARASGGTWQDDDNKVQVYAQKVQKSISSYLSKYLGKAEGKSDGASGFPPSRWWASTRVLKKLVDAQTVHHYFPPMSPDQAEQLLMFSREFLQEWSSFSVPLINSFTREFYGFLGISDSLQHARNGFKILQNIVDDVLSENLAEFNIITRLRHHQIFQRLRDYRSLNRELSLEDDGWAALDYEQTSPALRFRSDPRDSSYSDRIRFRSFISRLST